MGGFTGGAEERERLLAEVRSPRPVYADSPPYDEAAGLPPRALLLPPPRGVEPLQEWRGVPQLEIRF